MGTICNCDLSHQAGYLNDHFINAICVSAFADQLVFAMDQAGHNDPQFFVCKVEIVLLFLIPPHNYEPPFHLHYNSLLAC